MREFVPGKSKNKETKEKEESYSETKYTKDDRRLKSCVNPVLSEETSLENIQKNFL